MTICVTIIVGIISSVLATYVIRFIDKKTQK